MLIKNFQKLKVFKIILILIISGCSKEFQEKNFSIPDWKMPEQSSNHQKIYFAIYGSVFEPQEHLETKQYQEGKSISFKVGGKEALKEYLAILKKRFPQNLISISTGALINPSKDIAQTTLDLQFLKELSPDITHFNYKDLASLANEKRELKETKINFNINLINSNVIDHKNNEIYLPLNAVSEKVINIYNQKMAFLSINYAQDTETKQLIALPGLIHQDPILTILKAKEKLKAQGIHSFILLANIHSNCRSVVDFKKYHSFEFMENTELHCDEDDPLLKLVKRLPPHVVDAIILTNTNENQNNKFLLGSLNEIPIVKLDESGKYILLTEMSYDLTRFRADKKKFSFWPPIKLCEEFILSTQDCYINEFEALPTILKIDRPSELALIPAKFLGFEISNSKL